MAEKTGIGWCDHTWNPWVGCSKVSDECQQCYIEKIMKRQGREPFHGPVRTAASTWHSPRLWNKRAHAARVRRRVFTCSMSDFFHPLADDWRDAAWSVIRDCESLDWLICTKRADQIVDRLPADWGDGWDHVWLGVTVGCRATQSRLDVLEQVPAKLKWVSVEPLLQRLDLRPYLTWLDWVVTGCEQAAKGKRRLMDMAWVRDLDQQCREHGVAHYFKQAYTDNKGRPRMNPLLDGRIVHEFPSVEKTEAA